MTDEHKYTCGACVHWQAVRKHPDGSVDGQCYRNPPTPYGLPSMQSTGLVDPKTGQPQQNPVLNLLAMYPPTKNTSRACGEYEDEDGVAFGVDIPENAGGTQ